MILYICVKNVIIMNKIPSVNLNDFLSNDAELKQKFVSEIGHAYESIGFVALKGHFLKDALVDSLYNEVKKFFDMPVEQKRQYEIPGIGGQRGYVSFGKESACFVFTSSGKHSHVLFICLLVARTINTSFKSLLVNSIWSKHCDTNI